jgi:hypothetical protein
MKELRIPVHSIIDVITNSSTEIYTYVSGNTEKAAYEILDEILKIAGSDKKAKDLFEVIVDKDDEERIDEYSDESRGFPLNSLVIKAKDNSISTMNIFNELHGLINEVAVSDY